MNVLKWNGHSIRIAKLHSHRYLLKNDIALVIGYGAKYPGSPSLPRFGSQVKQKLPPEMKNHVRSLPHTSFSGPPGKTTANFITVSMAIFLLENDRHFETNKDFHLFLRHLLTAGFDRSESYKSIERVINGAFEQFHFVKSRGLG